MTTVKYNPKTGKKLKKGQTVNYNGRSYTEGSSNINGTSSSSSNKSSSSSSSNKSSSSSSSNKSSTSSVINIDSNPSQKLSPGQVYTYKGQTYTQPGTSTSLGGSSSNSSSSSSSNSSPTISSANLKVGSTNTQAIKDLQTKLGITSDGIFGIKTQNAVKAYQLANGLTADGIVGINTAAKMNTTTSNINPANPTQPITEAVTPFSMDQSTYTVQPGDTNNPYNGEPLTDTNPGTVISKDTASTSYEDYSKTGDTPTSLYNATGRNSDWEQPALQEEKGVEKAAVASNIISSQFMSKITSDPSIVGFYVNALAYGGYTTGDVLNDMKRREMIDSGNTQAKSLKIIDPELNRNSYLATSDGQKSVQDTASIIPTFNLQGLLNPDILKYGANIPDELFKTLVPILDKNSQEFKDAVAKVKATYYDLATASLQATTEQEKAVADYNLKNFTEQLNKQYGIQLSDDAIKAWSQIEALEDTMSTRNLSGSGLEQEGIDSYLNEARKQNARLRDEKLTKAEIEKTSFYTSSASSAEIAKLTPEERKKFGLTPSADILQKFSIAALKDQYPNKPDDEIKAIHDSVIDENGNFRSTLYSKYYIQLATTATTNETNAEQQVILDAQNKENAAYRNYDQSQPFSVATSADNATVENNATTNNINSASTNAAANISTSLNNYNSNNGTPYTPFTSTSTVNSNSNTVSTTPNTTVNTPSPTPSTSPTTYKIVYGDTLSAIAARNGTTTAKLAELNGISDPNKIISGSIIKLK